MSDVNEETIFVTSTKVVPTPGCFVSEAAAIIDWISGSGSLSTALEWKPLKSMLLFLTSGNTYFTFIS